MTGKYHCPVCGLEFARFCGLAAHRQAYPGFHFVPRTPLPMPLPLIAHP